MATSIKEISKGRSDMFRVAPSDLHIREGWNARDFTTPAAKEHVKALTASIKENGVKTPIRVFFEDGKLWVTDGESRLRAVREAIKGGAQIETVPVINEERGSTEQDRLLTQIVGNSGKPFEPLEMANVFHRLLGLGLKETEIAKKVGRSRQHIIDMLALRSADPLVKEAIQSGEVSPTLALQVVKTTKGDKKKAADTITKAVKDAKASGKKKATAKNVKKVAPPAPKPVKPAKPAATEPAATPTAPTAPTPAAAEPAATPTALANKVAMIKAIFDRYDPTVLPGMSVEVTFAPDDWATLKNLIG